MASYGTNPGQAPLPLWGTLALQPGPRFQQIGDGDGGESPIPSPDKWGPGTGTGSVPAPGQIGDGRPVAVPGQIGDGPGTGTGTGVSVPWHSLPNGELCHDTIDSESAPKNGQVQLRVHAGAALPLKPSAP